MQVSEYLNELVEDICPVIDGLRNSSNKESASSLENSTLTSFSDLMNAQNIFASDTFTNDGNIGDSEKKISDILNISDLVADWRKTILNSIREVTRRN